MRIRMEQRLTELKTEFESGQQMLAEFEAKQANLRETLLRISGAIQVLEELLDTAGTSPGQDGVEPRPDRLEKAAA